MKLNLRTTRGEIHICSDLEELSRQAAARFVRLANEFVTRRGSFNVALSGGSTPRCLYTMLASPRFRENIDWQRVHLFWGDERCVPPAHAESNYRMVKEVLLSKVPIPPENIHRMPAEKEDPQLAAIEYERAIGEFFKLSGSEPPRFDLVLLGLGEDGHVASLFPGTAVLDERRGLVAAPYVEKLHAHRLTLTLPVLNHAANIILLVSGRAKAAILKDVLEGKYQPDKLPAQLIKPVQGKLLWMVDKAAASNLSLGSGDEA